MSGHYAIPQEPGTGGALLLAVVVHLALLAFLWIGVSWQSSEHGGVEAEIWDTQYREAAPKAAAPEPIQQKAEPQKAEQPEAVQPKSKPEPKQTIKEVAAKVDIALEQEKKRREAKQKADDEKRQKQEEDKRKKADADKKKKDAEDKRRQDAADRKRMDKEREENMRRIAGVAGTGGNGTAARSTGRSAGDPGYGDKIAPKIRANTRFRVPENLDGNPSVEYAIELLPDGSLRTRPRLLKPSGLPGFDEAVLRAIEMSVPYPPDRTGKVPSSFTLIRKPKG